MSLPLNGWPVLSQGIFSAIVPMVLATILPAPAGLRSAVGREVKQ